jgi:hypothetical protein
VDLLEQQHNQQRIQVLLNMEMLVVLAVNKVVVVVELEMQVKMVAAPSQEMVVGEV